MATPLMGGSGGGTGRGCLGRRGPLLSEIAPAFSSDLNGYRGSGPERQDEVEKKPMQLTIGIDVSKDRLDAYRLSDGQHVQVTNEKAGHKALIGWTIDFR